MDSNGHQHMELLTMATAADHGHQQGARIWATRTKCKKKTSSIRYILEEGPPPCVMFWVAESTMKLWVVDQSWAYNASVVASKFGNVGVHVEYCWRLRNICGQQLVDGFWHLQALWVRHGSPIRRVVILEFGYLEQVNG